MFHPNPNTLIQVLTLNQNPKKFWPMESNITSRADFDTTIKLNGTRLCQLLHFHSPTNLKMWLANLIFLPGQNGTIYFCLH